MSSFDASNPRRERMNSKFPPVDRVALVNTTVSSFENNRSLSMEETQMGEAHRKIPRPRDSYQ